ncbi:SDR family NAD(P)-dependent oxidoreductase [Actinokineospora iranica]|uniref:Uncharacterized oxidoreductase n=1 Tax=Actinokineospora iranica TaxID=1271860 RepID=A0A1G6RX63_9PSEU|nr:SDR family NAD(P)-dependent oxidoreductase [Actinokineospora iranica]SDD09001.1 uncharacterized oxidoreductase [Actinokineospora iranica]
MHFPSVKALVTGGTSGVGRDLARQLLAEGAAVAICGRDPDRLVETAEEMPGLHAIRADLAREGDLARLVDTATEALGGLSLLVHNAAVQLTYDLVGRDPGPLFVDIDAEIATDLIAPMKLTALALPHLLAAPAAAVVTVSTALAVSPKRSAPGYAAAKAGLRAFTKALRYQLDHDAPTVAVVEAMLPLVDTPMTAGRGAAKITSAAAAAELLAGLRAARTEIHIGRAKTFLVLHRIAPRRADALLRDA